MSEATDFGTVVAWSDGRGAIVRDGEGTVRYVDTWEELDADQCNAHGVWHEDRRTDGEVY